MNGDDTFYTYRETFSYNSGVLTQKTESLKGDGPKIYDYTYLDNKIIERHRNGGLYETYVYDNELIISSERQAFNKSFKYIYDTNGSMIREEEYLGEDLDCATEFSYDNNLNLITRVNCTSSTTNYEYFTSNSPESVAYPMAFAKIYRINFKNRSKIEYSFTPDARLIEYEYNNDNLPSLRRTYIEDNKTGELKPFTRTEYYYEIL